MNSKDRDQKSYLSARSTKHHRKGDITRKRDKKRLTGILLQEKITILPHKIKNLQIYCISKK